MHSAGPTPSPTVAPETTVRAKTTRAPYVLAAAAAVAAIAVGVLYLQSSADLEDAKDDIAALETANSQLQQDIDAATAAEAARRAELDALPDVYAVLSAGVADMPDTTVDGDETYASVDIEGVGLYDISGLEAALVELGFPESIGARIGNTRALDGTLTADGDKVTASWTYHPDNGLSLVVERDD